MTMRSKIHLKCKQLELIIKFVAMFNVKISLVTITYNAATTIQRCITSVINQTYSNIEYIVIDGNSSDGTQQIVNKNRSHIHLFKSEPDLGIYDAMNKGISLCTGDIIGVLNADDYFANENVLSEIAQSFTRHDTEILYADLDYVNNQGRVIRKWRSGHYDHHKFDWGWMPPHPTFYVKGSYLNNLVCTVLIMELPQIMN